MFLLCALRYDLHLLQDLKLSWRRRLAQAGALLGRLTRIFVETVQTFYAERAAKEDDFRNWLIERKPQSHNIQVHRSFPRAPRF